MRAWKCMVLVALALGPVTGTLALTPPEVDHLMQRAAFGAAPSDYARMAPLDRRQAVDLLVSEAIADTLEPELPDWARPAYTLAYLRHDAPDPDPKKAAKVYWWRTRPWLMDVLLNAPSPLRARMLLHWHEYFPIIAREHAASVLRRDAMLYPLALGDYREVIVAFSRDGSTMENLDLKQNRRGAINENFGRELLELYTLGRGHYSQDDIREVSRAFTGWAVHRRTGVFMVQWPYHDFGTKTVLGRTGRFDGDDVLEVIFDHPRFAEHQVERMWRTFVSPDPDAALVREWSERFRKSQYSMAELLRTVLGSDAFWAPSHRLALVKGPVELVVGALRAEGLGGSHGAWMDLWATQMGQKLYQAPDVKGWRGYTDWLNVATIDTRLAFLQGMRSGFEAGQLASFESSGAFEQYPAEQARADTARLWQAVEQSRQRRGAPTMAMASTAAMQSGVERFDPTRNLK